MFLVTVKYCNSAFFFFFLSKTGTSVFLVTGANDLPFSSPRNFIMLGSGFKAERLRVNLRLVINRLKLLEKKKSEYLRG